MSNPSTQRKEKSKSDSGANRFLPLILVGGGILLVVLAFFILRDRQGASNDTQPQVSGAPAITVQPADIDLGDVKLGTPVETTFTISNVGDEALQFSETPYIELVEGC